MNRLMRRLKHKLILAPVTTKLPIQGLRLGKDQKKYTCICGSGWLSISVKEPTEAFDAHIKRFTAKEEDGK